MIKEEILINRMKDLSRISYERGIITYSNFLNLNEQDIVERIQKNEWYTNYEFYGGYQYGERQIVSFLPDVLCYENIYPISILKITPKGRSFSEKLSHRDYLGSIIGLGIDRNKIGDILVQDNCAIIFVHHSIVSYVIDHFTKVRNTYILIEILDEFDASYSPTYIDMKGSVASIRLDTVLAIGMKESRSKLIRLIEGGKVFVNGKLITTNAYKLHEQDIISVRGYGKFQYDTILSTTKKDRLYINIKKFV